MALVNRRQNLGSYGALLNGLGAAERTTYRALPVSHEPDKGSQSNAIATIAANFKAQQASGNVTSQNGVWVETPEAKEKRRVAALNAALAKHYADNPNEVPDAKEIAKQTAALTYDPSRWTKAVAAVTAPSSPWVNQPVTGGGGGGGGGSASEDAAPAAPALALPTGLAGWTNQKKLMVAGGAVAALVVLYLALKKKS